MIYSVKIPDAGFGIVEGKIIRWHKNPGDKVEKGEIVVSVETEKITVDIPAQYTGFLREIIHREGETLPIGTVIGVIEDISTEDVIKESIKEQKGKIDKGVELQGDNTQIKGETINKIGGAYDKKFIIKYQVEKSNVKGNWGGEIPPVVSDEKKKTFTSETQPKVRHLKTEKVSPAARALAKAHGVDLSILGRGSGPGGRIVKADVERFILRKLSSERGLKENVAVNSMSEKVYAPGKKVLFQGWQKVMASRMMTSARLIPQYTMSIEVDVTKLSEFIESNKERSDLPKLTYLPFVMKAVVAGISVIPEVNAYCNDEGYTILEDINIGVAVSQDYKLIVPVVKKVQEKSIVELAIDIQKLIQNARSESLKPEDVQGGTFTITNIGVYGIYSGTSLVLPPQTAIMYMGVVSDTPSVCNDTIVIRKKMLLGSTFDHRVITGGRGAKFLGVVKEVLENPDSFNLHSL